MRDKTNEGWDINREGIKFGREELGALTEKAS